MRQRFQPSLVSPLQRFCLRLFLDVSHAGLHLSSVNLLPSAVINDNVMKGFSAWKKKKRETLWTFALVMAEHVPWLRVILVCSAALSGKRPGFVCSGVGVKWWVCRETPIFDSELASQKLLHSCFLNVAPQPFIICSQKYIFERIFQRGGTLTSGLWVV